MHEAKGKEAGVLYKPRPVKTVANKDRFSDDMIAYIKANASTELHFFGYVKTEDTPNEAFIFEASSDSTMQLNGFKEHNSAVIEWVSMNPNEANKCWIRINDPEKECLRQKYKYYPDQYIRDNVHFDIQE